MFTPELTENSKTSRDVVKRYLINKKLIKYQCNECSITNTYNSRPITLHLDHINGINNDNRLENLRVLCPNCHSQTPTYCGKSKGKKGTSICSCGDVKYYLSSTCLRCAPKLRLGTKSKIIWPSVQEIKDKLSKTSYLALSRELGVSDNAIRHHLLRRGEEV